MNKVPDSLRKALYNYMDKSEDEVVDNLIKQGFPDKQEEDEEKYSSNR